MSVPTTTLNDGNKMPLLGLGTFQAPKGQTKQVITWALAAGYRHFDCADFYENEDEIGEALEEAFKSGVVKRSDLFITTKVWPNWFGPGRPFRSALRSLKNLKLDYLDLLLVHWPTPLAQVDDQFYPTDASGQALFDDSIELINVWKEFEQIKAQGLTKSIGVSNFNSVQIQNLIDNSKTVPAVDQVECHPALSQARLLEWARARGIVLTAYSPLARTGTEEQKNTSSPLDDPTIKAIASAHNATPAQVCIRWQAQRGVVVIPKSATKARLESNFNVFGFELTAAEMEQMNALNKDLRNNTWCQFGINKSKHWPFGIPF